MKEHAVLLGKKRTLVGITTCSDTFTVSRNNKIGVIFFNSGLIHRVGPSRVYVKLARKLAELGFVVLRFDMSGIGDSQTNSDNYPQKEIIISEAREAMEYLQRNNGVERFIPIGNCAGAAAAFSIAENDSRIIGTVLINPQAPISEQTYQMNVLSWYANYALYNKKSWLKLLTLKSDFRVIWKTVGLRIKQKFIPRYLKKTETAEVVERIEHSFEELEKRKIKLLFVLSGYEIGYKYLKELLGAQFVSMKEAGLIHSESLPKTDHNITPIRSQNKLIDIVSTWVQEECGQRKESTTLQ